MKKILLAIAAVSVLFVTGCSEYVPPAHKGKVLAPSGFTPDIHPAGKVGGFGPFSRNKLILLETGTQTATETMTVKLSDDAKLTFDVKFRTRIAGSEDVLNSMFDDIVLPQGSNKVTLSMVYNTYGKMIIRNKSREVMNDYAVDEISKNYDRISSELAIAIKEGFVGIPLEMSDVALGNVEWPKEVTAAINATLKSRAEIAKIEADKLKDLADAKAREAIAEANYAAEMVEARTLRDYNKTVASGISQNFLQFKALQTQEKMIKAMQENPNSNTIYMPYDALGTMGAQMQMFNK